MKIFSTSFVLLILIVWIISTLLMVNLQDFLFDNKSNFWKYGKSSRSVKITVYIILLPVYIASTLTFISLCAMSVFYIIFLVTRLFSTIISQFVNLI